MKALSVIAIGLLLMSAEQLCAQRTESPGRASDPFGPTSKAANRATLGSPDSAESRQAEEAALAAIARSQPIFVGADKASYARIYAALDREARFDYLDQPLKEVIDDISFTNNIPIVIDTNALEDFGIDTGTPITLSLKGISLRSALRLMLQKIGLTYVIRDELLQITTPEKAAANPSIHLYPVTGLVPPNGDGEALVELIKKIVAPKTWCGADAAGSIVYVEHLESLVIRQTDEVFHEIEELLAATKILAQRQRPNVPARSPDPFR